MAVSAPQIGFDRFIRLNWAEAALKVRAGVLTLEDLNSLLDEAGLGSAARTKTKTVLNRLWLEPRPELARYADRGIEIYKADRAVPVAVLSWGMAIAMYPFFGKVAELVGRLSALQGDCASAEVHRRMSEIYGEREGTYRMTNMVLQTQSDWGAIERVEKGKRLVRQSSIAMRNEQAVAWLIEGALRYVGRAMPVTTLQSLTVLYPFTLGSTLSYVLSKSPSLEMRSEGGGNQFVALRLAP
jgi:hypothetical protein